MKELELNIDANDKEWLYNQYINLQRGLKDIADWKCKICGSKHKINAHHILFANDFPERRFDTSNGITLCDEHHKKVHSPNSKELLLKNPNIGGSPEVDNPEASIREYLFSLIRSND